MRAQSQRPDGSDRSLLVSALRLSLLSVLWTVVSSSLAVVIGLRERAFVLVTFGAVGIVDCVGSVALALHFAHALRRDSTSRRLEAIAHRIVLTGLFAVGVAAVAVGALRLTSSTIGSSSVVGTVLAGSSFVVLSVLALRKVAVARRLPSPPLRSDGQLSGVGAGLAAVTLAGTVLESSLHISWADGTATLTLGLVAVVTSVATQLRRDSS